MTSIREIERRSIEHFLISNSGKLRGQVLDIGCGKQPYRGIVEAAGGSYIGFDRTSFAGSVVTQDVGEWWDAVDEQVDAVMMTQVWQYVLPPVLLNMLSKLASGEYTLKPGGWLIATGPTNWPIVEWEDLHRLTPAGVKSVLERASFREVAAEVRASVEFEGERWPLGWQAMARARE